MTKRFLSATTIRLLTLDSPTMPTRSPWLKIGALGLVIMMSAAACGEEEPRRIAFVGGSPGSLRIYVMDANGQNQQMLARGYRPAWSPDGTQIAYIASTGHDNTEIFVIDADGDNQQQITDITPYSVKNLAWSPEGSQIAYIASTGHDNTEIYVIDADGDNQRRLDQGDHPAWSPDGIQIAYTGEGESGEWDIFLIDGDGGNRQRFFTDYGNSPAWSPDGTQIAYFSWWEVLVMDTDGTNKRRITDNQWKRKPAYGGSSNWPRPAWSPDGTQIAYASEDVYAAVDDTLAIEGSHVTVLRVDGTQEHHLAESVKTSSLSWSPR